VIAYTVTATNKGASTLLRKIKIIDRIPLGFKYLAGSSFNGTTKIGDPISGKELMWTAADSLPVGNSVALNVPSRSGCRRFGQQRYQYGVSDRSASKWKRTAIGILLRFK